MIFSGFMKQFGRIREMILDIRADIYVKRRIWNLSKYNGYKGFKKKNSINKKNQRVFQSSSD